MFGNLYILGPYWPNKTLQLVPNPGDCTSSLPAASDMHQGSNTGEASCTPHAGTWNRKFGLLFIDQPVGTGYSVAGERGIPTDEVEVAADLYIGLQEFFGRYKKLQERPLFITGESYAGKYVPSIGAYPLC